MPDEEKKPIEDEEKEEQASAKGRLNELLTDIDMHGVPRISMDLHIAKKVIWVVVMFVLLGVAIWQLYTVVQYFMTLPTSTSFEYVYGRELNFPAVTICNLNPFRESRVTKLPDGATRDFFLAQKNKETGNVGPKSSGSGTFSWDEINFDDQRTDFDSKVEFYTTFMSLTRNEQKEVGYSIKDMLLDCAFNGKTCSPKNFTWTPHAQFGNCYTFNVPDENGTVATVSSPGPINGLSLTLYVDQSDYFPTISEAAGIKVLVHNQQIMPFPEEGGMLISPGTDTQIGIRQVTVLKAEYPWGDCKNFTDAEAKQKDAYVEMMRGVNYTSEGCEKTCFQKEIYKKCGCKHAFYVYEGEAFNGTDVPTASFCKIQEPTTRRCIAKLERLLHEGSLTCSKDCPPNCLDFTYPSTVASSSWPAQKKEADIINMLSSTNPSLQKMIGNLSTKAEQRRFMHEQILRVSVFFQHMRYQYVVTSPAYTELMNMMNMIIDGDDNKPGYKAYIFDEYKRYKQGTEEMVSDLGGTVELYLGLSIVTVMEVVEFIMDLCFICAQKRKAKKINKTVPVKA